MAGARRWGLLHAGGTVERPQLLVRGRCAPRLTPDPARTPGHLAFEQCAPGPRAYREVSAGLA